MSIYKCQLNMVDILKHKVVYTEKEKRRVKLVEDKERGFILAHYREEKMSPQWHFAFFTHDSAHPFCTSNLPRFSGSNVIHLLNKETVSWISNPLTLITVS